MREDRWASERSLGFGPIPLGWYVRLSASGRRTRIRWCRTRLLAHKRADHWMIG